MTQTVQLSLFERAAILGAERSAMWMVAPCLPSSSAVTARRGGRRQGQERSACMNWRHGCLGHGQGRTGGEWSKAVVHFCLWEGCADQARGILVPEEWGRSPW